MRTARHGFNPVPKPHKTAFMSIWSRIGEFARRVSASASAGAVDVAAALRNAFAGDPELRRKVAFSVAMIALSAKMAKADGVDFGTGEEAQPTYPQLLGSVVPVGYSKERGQTLYAIGGLPPNLMRIPPGCPFNPRCVYATDVCRTGEPPALVG